MQLAVPAWLFESNIPALSQKRLFADRIQQVRPSLDLPSIEAMHLFCSGIIAKAEAVSPYSSTARLSNV